MENDLGYIHKTPPQLQLWFLSLIHLTTNNVTVLEIKRDNLGIISHISP